MRLTCKYSLSLRLFAVLLITGISVRAQTVPFRIIGYIPNWIDIAAFSQSFDFRQVTHLNYAFQNPDASGNLVESNTGLAALVSKAHANNVKVLISIGGGGAPATSGTIKSNFQNLISTSDKRASFIHKIAIYIKAYKLDGLDVDEEGPAINSDYGAFIKQLADSLKPKGLLLTTAVGWGSENIPNSAFKYFDWVNLMAYDLTGNWDLTRPGQHSPFWYAQKMIKDFVARGVKKENLCLGVPFYGYGFYKSVGSYSYNSILTRFPEAWKSDQAGDTIYYNGMNTIWMKTKLAMSEASGIMIWELSQDSKTNKSLLAVIRQTADSLKTNSLSFADENKQPILYPNPVKNQLIIDHLISEKLVKVEIFDLKGDLVKSQEFKSMDGRIRLRIGSLHSGSYVCQIITSAGIYSKVFVKE